MQPSALPESVVVVHTAPPPRFAVVMFSPPLRETRHVHHASLTSFDAIKTLQADLTEQQHLHAPADRARISRSAQSNGGNGSLHAQKAPATVHPLSFAPPSGVRSRARTSARLVPASWNPKFQDKPASYKRELIRVPHHFPVCTLHLAAITIQRWWRALPRSRRTKRSTRRLQTLPTWQHPWEKLKRIALPTGRRSQQREALSSPMTSLQDHCAVLIQRAWRASRERRHRAYLKRRMYRVAARSIQEWWRDVLWRKAQRRVDEHWAAVVIQRAFRSHADRRVYHFFRDQIRGREHTEPTALLRALEARDGLLSDSASGLYVRLRLGGPTFPPLLLYKLFTAQPVVDLNAFAPRHYAADQRALKQAGTEGTDVSLWYRRWENNGWRVVGGSLLTADCRRALEAGVRTAQSQRPHYHHPNRAVRRVDAERRRKERRVAWMKRMYKHGRDEERKVDEEGESKAGLDLFDITQRMGELIGQGKEDREAEQQKAREKAEEERRKQQQWEEDVDALVDWAADLDFDKYQSAWHNAGATRAALKHGAGTDMPIRLLRDI